MTQRLLVFVALVLTFVALASGLAVGCSGTVTPAGLVIIFKTDGSLPQATRLHYDISSFEDARVFGEADKRIPSDTTLPTTLAIDSLANPTETVLINVSLWDDTTTPSTLLDDRQNQIIDIPTTQVTELTIVFSAMCTHLAITEGDGTAGSTCTSGNTCDYMSGTCTTTPVMINAGKLPTFDGGLGSTFADAGEPPADAADATLQGDGSPVTPTDGGFTEAGQPDDAAPSEASTVALLSGRVFALEVGDTLTADDLQLPAALDVFPGDGGPPTQLAIDAAQGAFSLNAASTGALAVSPGAQALFVIGQNVPPMSNPPDHPAAIIFEYNFAQESGSLIPALSGVQQKADDAVFSATSDGLGTFYFSTSKGVYITDGGVDAASAVSANLNQSAFQLAAVDNSLLESGSNGVEFVMTNVALARIPGGVTGFTVFDVSGGGMPDLAYASSDGGLVKWQSGEALPADGGLPNEELAQYVTGVMSGNQLTIFVTTAAGDAIYRIDDTVGGDFSSAVRNAILFAKPLQGGQFRGIAYVP